MCGIFGWQTTNLKTNMSRKFSIMGALLMYQNDTRGGHSWGVIAGNAKLKVPNIFRGLGDITGNNDPVYLTNFSSVMAHTRYASHGKVNILNAHPFEIKNIIGSHNGIVSNHNSLNEKYKRNFEVDSMHIFKHLADKLDVSDIDAYGAIEFINKNRPGVVYLSVFNSGELAVYKLKKDKGIIWTSSEAHAKASFLISGLEVEKMNIKENVVYEVENGEIFKTDACLNFGNYSSPLKWNNYASAHYPSTQEELDDWEESFDSGNTKKGKYKPKTAERVYTSLAELEKDELLEGSLFKDYMKNKLELKFE